MLNFEIAIQCIDCMFIVNYNGSRSDINNAFKFKIENLDNYNTKIYYKVICGIIICVSDWISKSINIY